MHRCSPSRLPAALVSALASLLPGLPVPGAAGAGGAAAAQGGELSDGATYLREVLRIPLAPKPSASYSWQLPGDTYLSVLRSREGQAPAAEAVPANAAAARAWIAAWRAKQGRA